MRFAVSLNIPRPTLWSWWKQLAIVVAQYHVWVDILVTIHTHTTTTDIIHSSLQIAGTLLSIISVCVPILIRRGRVHEIYDWLSKHFYQQRWKFRITISIIHFTIFNYAAHIPLFLYGLFHPLLSLQNFCSPPVKAGSVMLNVWSDDVSRIPQILSF